MTPEHVNTVSETWRRLLENGEAPIWLAKAVGIAFVEAHRAGKPFNALPSSVLVDVNDKAIVLDEAIESQRRLPPPDDLALCTGRLLSLALHEPQRMRHIFQQVALLWRTYRDARGLGMLSAMEAEFVPTVVSFMTWPEGLGEALRAATAKQIAAGKVPTLHDLIDVLFYYVTDAQYRGRRGK